MRYAAIYKFDISNGPGIRVSLFTQGCAKHCKGCFNPETWDFKGGYSYDETIRTKILRLCEPEYVAGLSILGGEPLTPENIGQVADLCIKFKSKYPNKNIWLWTGFTWEELGNFIRGGRHRSGPDGAYAASLNLVLQNVDVVVEGPFIEKEKDLTLKWRGSRNQHIYRKGGTGKMSQNPNMFYAEG